MTELVCRQSEVTIDTPTIGSQQPLPPRACSLQNIPPEPSSATVSGVPRRAAAAVARSPSPANPESPGDGASRRFAMREEHARGLSPPSARLPRLPATVVITPAEDTKRMAWLVAKEERGRGGVGGCRTLLRE